MIRWICGVKPQDRIRSDDLLIKLRLADIENVLMSNRLRWYGHAKRSQDYINTIMDVEVEKGKKKGNRKTWKQCVDNGESASWKMLTLLIGSNGEELSRNADCCLPLIQGIR